MKLNPKLAALLFAVITVTICANTPSVAVKGLNDVKYLPAWRYSGDASADRDGQMLLDITVPDDDQEKHPVLFVVHGGGWSAGSKDQDIYRDIVRYFVKRGFVCVNLNYILRPRGMFPQVFWDYADAARFMRKNAATYKVDPARFGAIGLSAGGWLISSAGHGSGDLLCTSHQQSVHIVDLWQRGWSRNSREYEDTFARPIANPRPAYPGAYGRFQAISYDFSFRTQFGSGNSPACNQWVGEGYQLRRDDQVAIDTGKFDYTQTVMTHASLKGRKVHVPPLFSSIQKDGSNKAEAISRDGKSRVDAIERIYHFFHYELIENPRAPMPEIQPAWRMFNGEQKVNFVTPIDNGEIRYEVVPLAREKGKSWDELAPPVGDTAKWQRYTGPFTVKQDCLVRAIATSEGRRESTVAEAHFFTGVDVANITNPIGEELPPAETGKAYDLQFESNVKNARWFLAGDLVPYPARHKAHFTYPNNMVMNYQTGQWSGTPTKPGKYWIQVWVNDRPGALARHRDYTWTVTGEDLTDKKEVVAELRDPHVELVFLPAGEDGRAKWVNSQISQLLNQRGIPVIVDTEESGSLILVRDDDRDRAKTFVEEFLTSVKYKGEVRWP